MADGGRSDCIAIERRGDIEILTLNRPAALNALSPEMTGDLYRYFDGLSARTDVRVVVLRGEGRAFCAGLDLKGWEQPQGVTPALHTLNTQLSIGNIMRRMRSCPQPIIALVQGPACGGGFSLALSSDVRFGAPSLKMNAAYIKIGLGGCDMASSYLLPRLVGRSVASELLLTGRFITAERALRVGLISDIVAEDQLLDAGLAMAEEMLLTSPYGLRLTKQALELNTDAPSMEAAMALEGRQQVILSATEDSDEARRAFFEKRAPCYSGN
jgi:enoyl-CoA hydratase/carnithine racemase